ncbi:MAG: hypothetical protein AAF493_21535 [Pseudomonadota bacterium]
MALYKTLLRSARPLEIITIVLAVGALIYRATVYWKIPVAPGEPYGLGDLIDFGLGLLVFLIACICAACGVGISMTAPPDIKPQAYRPLFIGMGSFLLYYFLHPHVPRLL